MLNLDDFINRVKHLPPAPRILPELLALLRQSDVDSSRVVQLVSFDPPEGFNLVGDYHIQRALPFVIGGAPGVGKSRLAAEIVRVRKNGSSYTKLPASRCGRSKLERARSPSRLKESWATATSALDGLNVSDAVSINELYV